MLVIRLPKVSRKIDLADEAVLVARSARSCEGDDLVRTGPSRRDRRRAAGTRRPGRGCRGRGRWARPSGGGSPGWSISQIPAGVSGPGRAGDQAVVGEHEPLIGQRRRRSAAGRSPRPGRPPPGGPSPRGRRRRSRRARMPPPGCSGADRVADVDELRPGGQAEHDPLHRGHIRTVSAEVGRQRDDARFRLPCPLPPLAGHPLRIGSDDPHGSLVAGGTPPPRTRGDPRGHPPAGLNWPITRIRRGWHAATRSSRIVLIECS